MAATGEAEGGGANVLGCLAADIAGLEARGGAEGGGMEAGGAEVEATAATGRVGVGADGTALTARGGAGGRAGAASA